ncbi:hypothetical protein FB470_001112 [Amycolatopsis thermophila]|uniref:Secreted protein n=1 Tax=Amycolatopsis thermophila TaxID=206084 RepID=A0ABU0EPA0_9PSEU|nr:hypothetical protein [Amycolatopsis thermophila]
MVTVRRMAVPAGVLLVGARALRSADRRAFVAVHRPVLLFAGATGAHLATGLTERSPVPTETLPSVPAEPRTSAPPDHRPRCGRNADLAFARTQTSAAPERQPQSHGARAPVRPRPRPNRTGPAPQSTSARARSDRRRTPRPPPAHPEHVPSCQSATAQPAQAHDSAPSEPRHPLDRAYTHPDLLGLPTRAPGTPTSPGETCRRWACPAPAARHSAGGPHPTSEVPRLVPAAQSSSSSLIPHPAAADRPSR